MLFVSIPGPSFAQAVQQVQNAEMCADGAELRLDLFENLDLEQIRRLLEKSKLPMIFTLRRKDQGGRFVGPEETRFSWLEKLCSLKPAYVDLEWDIPMLFIKQLHTKFPAIKFISSYHNFTIIPDLEEVFVKMRSPHVRFYKIAIPASSTIDALKLLSFAKAKNAENLQVIGIAMGEKGQITRILGPIFGSPIEYCSTNQNEPTAPGQMTAEEMSAIYHHRSLNVQSSILGLIGDPINQSIGHLAHNAVIGNLKKNAVYVKLALKKEELASFFSYAKKMPFLGLSVTMPLKDAVLPFLDTIDDDARSIGAVNTLCFEKGKIAGFNTDGAGALDAIEQKLLVQGKKVVILGAGGAAKAIIHEAIKRRAHVCILNRTAKKAQSLADLMGCDGGGLDLMPDLYERGYDILIKCTPDDLPIEPRWILPGCLVMDIVYLPKETPFLLQAASKGCQLVFGYEMYVNQAALQCIIWYGNKIDRDQVKDAIAKKALDSLETP